MRTVVFLSAIALALSARAGTEADVAIAVTLATPAPFVPGKVVSYSVAITNNGPAVAEAVRIENAPDQLFITSANSSDPFDFCFVLPCDLGVHEVGETTVVGIEGVITGAGMFSDELTVTAFTADPNASNNVDGTTASGLAIYTGAVPLGAIATVSSATDSVHAIFPARGTIEPITGGRVGGTQFGDGVDFVQPTDILVLPSGLLVVADTVALIAVDPATRNRSVLSGPGVGSGPAFNPSTVVRNPLTGELIVASATDRTIYSVDPTTGDRGVISDNVSAGSGPLFERSADIAVLNLSTLVVNQLGIPGMPDGNAIYTVDIASGDRAVYSGETAAGTVGLGPEISTVDIAVRRGEVVYFDLSENAVMRIDPVLRDRIVLSGPGVGTGPSLAEADRLTVTGGGDILLATDSGIFCINGDTGDRFVLARRSDFPTEPPIVIEDLAVPEGLPERIFASEFEDQPPALCRI